MNNQPVLKKEKTGLIISKLNSPIIESKFLYVGVQRLGIDCNSFPHLEQYFSVSIYPQVEHLINLFTLYLLLVLILDYAPAPNGLRYLRWGVDGEAVQLEK